MTNYSILITDYYSPLTDNYLWPLGEAEGARTHATYCLPLAAYYLLPTTYYLLLTISGLLVKRKGLNPCYLLLNTCCLLLTTYYILLTTYYFWPLGEAGGLEPMRHDPYQRETPVHAYAQPWVTVEVRVTLAEQSWTCLVAGGADDARCVCGVHLCGGGHRHGQRSLQSGITMTATYACYR